MRTSWFLAAMLVAASWAVPGGATELSPQEHAGTRAPESAPVQSLPQLAPAALFATGFLCGTCAGGCSGLFTGSACTEGGESGVCIGLISGGSPARCSRPDTGYVCFCQTLPPE